MSLRIAALYGPQAFGGHRPPINFADPNGQSLTGTDLVAIFYPHALAQLGHDVTLFVDRAASWEWDNVHVRPFTEWNGKGFDIAISASNPNALELATPDTLRLVNRQVSKFAEPYDCKPGWQKWVDIVMCPSRTALEHVRVDGPDFVVLPNACDPSSFATGDERRVPGRCAYISSPDRGLHWVLQAWPHIRKAVPHATLRVFYESLESWIRHHVDPNKKSPDILDVECTRRAVYIDHALRKLEKHGVQRIGGVSHRQLAVELSQAQCLLYPCDTLGSPERLTETFGVAVLEAQAAGCVPVISNCDAFGELWRSTSACVDAPMRDSIRTWTDAAVDVLANPATRQTYAEMGRANAAKYTWQAGAAKLEDIIGKGLAKKRGGAITVEDPPLTIHMVLSGYASGDVRMDPENPHEAHTGGGCRTGFVELAHGLAARGHRVRAFSTWARNATVAGVECCAGVGYGGECDALLAYYDTRAVADSRARMTIASHHTYQLPFEATVRQCDLNTAPSDHAVRALRTVFGGEHWLTLPNIVPPGLPEWRPVRGRVLYHTSADRGLHRLVRMWPRIRSLVPGAKLHIVGDVEGFCSGLRGSRGTLGDRARWLLDAMPAAMDAGGVELLGKLSRAEVHRELSEAACVALPFDPPGPCETWSTTIAESCSVGVPVVFTPIDALGELWDGSCEASTSDEDFRYTLVNMLKDDAWCGDVSRDEKEHVSQFTADYAARILEVAIREALARKSSC